MKNISRIIPSCCFAFLLLAFNGQAQNNLTAGSIGFTSYQSDQDLSNVDSGGTTAFTDRFSIVIQNQTGLAANTVIYFTDNGWNASTGDFISGLSEGFIKWVVPTGGYPFGTQIYFISKYVDPVTSWGAYKDEKGTIAAGVVTTESGNNYMELSTGGDQVLAYQTGPTRGPAGNYNNITRRFLSGFNMYNSNWNGSNPAGGHQSSVPPGLTNGVTAFSPGNWDNAQKIANGTISGCQSTLSAQLYTNFDWRYQNTAFKITADSLLYSITPGAVITTDPFDVTRCQGISASFSATTNYTTSYQWQQSADAAFTTPVNLTNTGIFSGATSNTLNIGNNATVGGQYFRVVVSNATCGSSTSEGALLSLSPLTTPAATTTCTQLATANNYTYVNLSCELIAIVQPAGSNPIAGNVASKVWIENRVPIYDGQPFVARHYQILPDANAAAATGTINLYFTQAEFNDFNAKPGSTLKLPTGRSDAIGKSNLRIGRYTGSSSNGSGLPGTYTGNIAVIVPQSVAWDSTGNRWIVSFDATGFGGFIVQTSAIPLPVNLLSFSGRLVNDDIHLQWKTTSETNNDYFEIERGLDGQTFTAIGRTAGINGVTTQSYNWVDAAAAKLHSPKLYYRLKIVSTTGEVEYSSVVTISVNTAGSPVVTITPNPFTSQVNINLQLPAAAQLTLTLSDVTGKKLKSEYVNASKGISTISLTGLSNLMQGIYLLSIQYNGQTYTYKLVK
ncbi:MAG: T9SS type A sorting domain-containing protein [Niastella sp.]|uniref:T9SS type A sorting domain-containing protein n=1 Tax=Niastella sp. TaxID=1869183 RepID=UPI00389A21EF